MDILEFYDWCVKAHAQWREHGDDFLHGLVKEVAAKLGQAPATLYPAVTKLPKVTRPEVEDNPELGVAHWLVLADLIPDDFEFRRFWIHRCKFMRFTAKAMRAELAGAIELQKKLGPDWRSVERRRKHHNE